LTAAGGVVAAGGSAIAGGGASGMGGTANGGSSSSGAAGLGGASSQLHKPWDLTGIIGTGQSLSVGVLATPTLTTQPYRNLKLSLGGLTVPPYDPQSSLLSLVPLVEPIRPTANPYPSPYPANIFGETPHTAMGNQLTALYEAAANQDYVTVHTVVGENGQPMSVINKTAVDTGTTGRAFAATLFEVQAISRLAKAAGKSYGVGAIILTHGEADAGSDHYEADLFQLWSDYNTSIQALTGQSDSIPLLLTQQHSVPADKGSVSSSTFAQWRAGVDHPGQIVCVGPKYQHPYVEKVHMPALGYELVGEKSAQVYFERVVKGLDWQPLQPTSVEHAGNLVTVHFHIPVPPLVWDATLGEPHQSVFTEWQNGHGFEVADGSGTPVKITTAQIVGDAVQLTCATDPGTSGVVRYAVTADGVARPDGTQRWGTLRDSDPIVGATTGKNLPNFAVAFQLPVVSQ
jgi:hypothetical protein